MFNIRFIKWLIVALLILVLVTPAFIGVYALGNSQGYQSGNTAGYAQGYSAGYGKGQTDGYSSGYTQGSTDGYNSGYSVGYQSGSYSWQQNCFNYPFLLISQSQYVACTRPAD